MPQPGHIGKRLSNSMTQPAPFPISELQLSMLSVVLLSRAIEIKVMPETVCVRGDWEEAS